MPQKIWNMYRGVRRNVCLQNNVRLQRWMTHIYRLHYMWTHHFSNMATIWIFPQGARHVIKMQIHVRHTNMVSLNRFWNMLYLTFHGFESLNSREIRLAPSLYVMNFFYANLAVEEVLSYNLLLGHSHFDYVEPLLNHTSSTAKLG